MPVCGSLVGEALHDANNSGADTASLDSWDGNGIITGSMWYSPLLLSSTEDASVSDQTTRLLTRLGEALDVNGFSTLDGVT